MNRKTISKTIRLKMEAWIASLPTRLQKEVKDNLLVSGGSITSLFLGEEVNDYDIYLQDRGVLKSLMEYYSKSYPEISILDGPQDSHLPGIEGVVKRNMHEGQLKFFVGNNKGGGFKTGTIEGEYRPLFFSPNAISLSDNVQIVNRFWGTPEEIHKTFDFIHATNYYTFKEGLVTNVAALESILSRTLSYQGSLYPVTSILRAKKFTKRKWNINAGEMLKIMFQISQLDLTNVSVLEDQLIGVDVAYFGMLINALESVKDKTKMTTEYVSTIIDNIFNNDESTGDFANSDLEE